MIVSKEVVTSLFNHYLKECIRPRSVHHHEVFDSVEGGLALTKRLTLCLRAHNLSYLAREGGFDLLEIFRLTREYLNKHKKIYIVGLDLWFSNKDLDDLENIYRRLFI